MARPFHDGRPRRVVVTGASSGIGRATADAFAQRGDLVFGTSRAADPDITSSTPGVVTMTRLDVTDPASTQECIHQIIARAGGIDVLVNNAGVMQLALAEETTDAQANLLIQTNLLGPARVIGQVLPGMRNRRRGLIINVGSLAAWIGEPGEAYYAATKAALARYTEALRQEVKHLGIGVSLIELGAFATPVLDHAITASRQISDYDSVRAAVTRTMRDAVAKSADASEAGRRIVAIATAERPKRRYAIGRGGYVIPVMQAPLPQRWTDTLLRRGYGLTDS